MAELELGLSPTGNEEKGKDTLKKEAAAAVVEEVRFSVDVASISLDRKSNLKKSLGFIFLFLLLETNKQINNFALSRSNDGHYPVPSTLLVVLAEVFKLIFILIWAKSIGLSVRSWIPSITFSLPAVCYCITNLMYLSALTVVSPPIWMILIQTRTLYTAAAYKIVFGRDVTSVQALGCLLVVCSVLVARLSALKDGHSHVTLKILLISQVCALLSTAASIAVELLLKNDGRTFCEQQWWLYVWGSFLGGLVMLFHENLVALTESMQTVLNSERALLQLVIAVASTSLAGLCVPVIVRNLDTIVKDYLGASNNLVLSIVTAIIFPLEFSLSWLYLLSLAILAAGIWLYEKKTLWNTP